MFLHPLSSLEAINKRSNIFKFFTSKSLRFPFHSSLFDAVEQYLADTDERTKLGIGDRSLGKKMNLLIMDDPKFRNIQRGVIAIIEIVHTLQNFIYSLRMPTDSSYQDERNEIEQLLSENPFEILLKEKAGHKLSYSAAANYDELIRFQHHKKIMKLLQYCYQLDVYVSVATVAVAYQFVFPVALTPNENILDMEQVYHPLVPNAVPNHFRMAQEKNIVFLTGANMAGKSTFMKSVGIAVLLAHMGFPVAAKQMKFSVLDGIYTSINLADNLGMGVSHFYAEVLRVKKVAKELQLSKRLFVMFDELFRGTNVKDAYEATIAITEGFARNRKSKFIISTHIIEAGEVLKEQCSNISFLYLPTKMDGSTPVYTYKLEQGITADRHGMVIINNEGILDILNKSELQTA
jgi:DNA mismatch repair ATPase MutS